MFSIVKWLGAVSIPQAVSTVATEQVVLGSNSKTVSIPQAVSTVATLTAYIDIQISLLKMVSIPQAVSTVATRGLF